MIKRIVFFAFCTLLCHSLVAEARSPDIVKIGTDAVIEEGTEVNDVAVIFGDLKVDGAVSGDAVVVGGDLTVGPTGSVGGDAVVILGKLIKLPGAEINKNIVEIPHCKKSCMRLWAFPILGLFAMGMLGLTLFAAFILIFVLIAVLFTDRVGRNSYYIESFPWKSLLYGFVTSILIVPVILLLAVSVIGIPIIPFFVVAVFAASLFGYATMCQLVGLRFFRAIKKPGQHMFWEVVVGLIIICLVVMTPFIGWFAKTLIWMTGLGATVATKFGGRR